MIGRGGEAEIELAILHSFHDRERIIRGEVHIPCFFIVGCELRRLNGHMLQSDMGFHLIEGERLAEEVALNLFAADVSEEAELFFCFHALCQGPDADLFRHVNGGLDDIFRALREIRQEVHVDLELIEVIVFECIQ